jgi:hypothetical protein
VQSPEASLKKLRISFRAAMSCFLGLTKIAVSSAYKEAFIPLDLGEIGCNTPLSAASWRILWSGSIANMKSMGDIGSPCRSPCSCLIGQPRPPFRRILDEEVAKDMEIHSHHLHPNPSLSSRVGQLAMALMTLPAT